MPSGGEFPVFCGRYRYGRGDRTPGISAGGYRWADATEEKPDMRERPNHSEVMRRVSGRSVVCVETGVRYASQAEAADAAHCRGTDISASCRYNTRKAGGFHWRYADEAVTVDG